MSSLSYWPWQSFLGETVALNNPRALVPEPKLLNGPVYLWLLNTMHVIVRGLPGLSPSCVTQEQKSHVPLLVVLSSTPWKWLLLTSAASWMPLDDVNLFIWKRASPETKHALVCVASLVGSHSRRVLWWLRPALSCWSLPQPLTPAIPKGMSLQKRKPVLAPLRVQYSPFLVKSFFTVSTLQTKFK